MFIELDGQMLRPLMESHRGNTWKHEKSTWRVPGRQEENTHPRGCRQWKHEDHNVAFGGGRWYDTWQQTWWAQGCGEFGRIWAGQRSIYRCICWYFMIYQPFILMGFPLWNPFVAKNGVAYSQIGRRPGMLKTIGSTPQWPMRRPKLASSFKDARTTQTANLIKLYSIWMQWALGRTFWIFSISCLNHEGLDCKLHKYEHNELDLWYLYSLAFSGCSLYLRMQDRPVNRSWIRPTITLCSWIVWCSWVVAVMDFIRRRRTMLGF